MEKEQSGKTLFRGELALVIAVLVNSFGVVLMLYSGAGISAISSVPYAFSLAFPALTLGTWTFFFLGRLEGLGIGTIAAAFTMGKGIGLVGDLLDKHFYFENYKTLRTAKNKQ